MQQLSKSEFFGVPKFRKQVGAYEIAQTRFASNEKLPTHSHEQDVMIIMVRGSRVDQLKETSVECRTGSIMLQSADVPHSNQFFGKRNNQVLNIVIPKRLYAQYSLDRLDSTNLTTVPLGQSRLLAARIAFEIQMSDNLSEDAIDEFMIEFVDCATGILNRRRYYNASPWIAKVVEYLNDCPLEVFRLSEIAEITGRHPAHVSRTFRRAIGCTIGTYLRHVRVARACTLLATSRRPIVEIAAESGFADESHLTRCMQAIFKTSPGRYRSLSGQC